MPGSGADPLKIIMRHNIYYQKLTQPQDNPFYRTGEGCRGIPLSILWGVAKLTK